MLLVACANLANLMLARGLKDRAQLSIRVALGASRGRLVRKVLVESVVLAMIGGLLGIGVAYAGTRLIVSLAFRIVAPITMYRSRQRLPGRFCCSRSSYRY